MSDDSDDYRGLFLSGVPLLDTRAPVEFKKGAFPHAVNLPLMIDVERQKVGTCYKYKGQKAAIALGHQLVSGELKQQRIAAWADFAKTNPHGYLYCFRGGLRSKISQQWLHTEAGIAYPRIIGGYKAMRRYLLQTLEDALAECNFVIVCGMTGTGKTDVVTQFNHVLDLEGLANHRGSSFGKRATAQPSQIEFENALFIDILKKRAVGISHFLLEDESHLIGSCNLPQPLREAMQHFPRVWLEDSIDNRIERILRDYVIDLSREYMSVHGEENGFSVFAEGLLKSLSGITRRLGRERYQQLAAIMQQALHEQQYKGEVSLHRVWIERLLAEYYDPMYTHQRVSKAERMVFVGDRAAVMEYLALHH